MLFSRFSLKSVNERAILCVLGELCQRLHSYNGKTCKNIRMLYITCYCVHELTLQKNRINRMLNLESVTFSHFKH